MCYPKTQQTDSSQGFNSLTLTTQFSFQHYPGGACTHHFIVMQNSRIGYRNSSYNFSPNLNPTAKLDHWMCMLYLKIQNESKITSKIMVEFKGPMKFIDVLARPNSTQERNFWSEISAYKSSIQLCVATTITDLSSVK